MTELATRLAALVEDTGFSGVVRVRGHESVDIAAGDAHRAERRPVRPTTRFATASGTKGFTALTILALVEADELALDSTVRSILGNDLPNVDEAVTIEHLLGHRSGIGDYLDEDELDDIDAHILGSRSVHGFDAPTAFLGLLGDPPQREVPGTTFRYNNSGFVLLSIIIERLTGSFVDAVGDRVFDPAGMTDSGFFRSDDLPADVAVGYLENGRSNVFHLPVIGAGDGGAYTNVDDLDRFWDALLAGSIVSPSTVERMTTPISTHEGDTGYGLGCWVSTDGDHVWLEGMDAGVSLVTGFRRTDGLRYSVLSNTSSGVWPLAKAVLGA
ncbi:MAG: serine hydrolase domain-containing protein [Actinomycetota bacterium]